MQHTLTYIFCNNMFCAHLSCMGSDSYFVRSWRDELIPLKWVISAPQRHTLGITQNTQQAQWQHLLIPSCICSSAKIYIYSLIPKYFRIPLLEQISINLRFQRSLLWWSAEINNSSRDVSNTAWPFEETTVPTDVYPVVCTLITMTSQQSNMLCYVFVLSSNV